MLAWDMLYERSYNTVCRYVAKRRRNVADWWDFSEDVVSEAYERAFRRLNRFSGKSKFSTWICGFAKNILLEKGRGLYRDAELIRRVGYLYLYSECLNPEHIAIISERNYYLWHAFYSLPMRQQLLIQYIVLMGMSQRKAAKQMRMSLSESMWEYNSAIENLRNTFVFMYSWNKDFLR